MEADEAADGTAAGGRSYHHGDLRRALLDEAAQLLERDGPDALSLRELARRAGVSPRAPYRHFVDKEALLSALAVEAFTAFTSALVAAGEVAPPGREIEEQALAYVAFARTAPARFRLMFGPRRVRPDDALARAKQTAFEVLRARASKTSGQPTGPGRPLQPDLHPYDARSRARAVGIWALVHGLAVLILDRRVQDEFDGPEDDIVRHVTRAMLSPEWR